MNKDLINEITKLSPMPGDIIVVKLLGSYVSAETARNIKTQFEKRYSDLQCIVITSDMDVSLLTRKEIEALAEPAI